MKKGNPNPSPATRFGAGNKANPGGKPVGARNRVTAKFLEALAEDFDEHGVKAIQATRTQDPATYIKVIASLLPKEVVVERSPLADMTDDELREHILREAAELGASGRRDEAPRGSKEPVGKPH